MISKFTKHHFKDLARGAAAAFICKAIGVALSFLLNVLIARHLGPGATGLFYLTFAIASVAGVISCLGLENTFLRHISAGAALNDWISIKGLYQKGISLVVPFSILLTGAIIFLSYPIASNIFQKPESERLIQIMAIAILPTVLVLLHAELLKGIHRIGFYLLIHSICVPAMTILVFLLLCVKMGMGIVGLAWGHLSATVAAAFLGIGLWRMLTNPKMVDVTPKFPWRKLLQSSLPLLWVNFMNFSMMWASVFFLGVWGTKDAVGIYATAFRTSMVTSFILIAVNTVAAPKYAEYYSLHQMRRLEETALASLKMMFVMAVPPLVAFIVFPHWIMGIFGSDFTQGGLCLIILACGQFINVSTGSVGYILMMSGHEHLLRNAITISGILNLILNLCLVPRFGITGGAIATATSISILNFIAAYYVWSAVKIKPLPLPFIKSRYERMT